MVKFQTMRTVRDLERSITHFDQDYELALYSRRKMWLNPKTGLIEVIPRVISGAGPGTLFTGIPAELLYHDTGTANTSVAGTAAEVVMNLYNPFGQSAQLPAGFWTAGGTGGSGLGRFAKVVLRGIVTTAASAGTAIFTT